MDNFSSWPQGKQSNSPIAARSSAYLTRACARAQAFEADMKMSILKITEVHPIPPAPANLRPLDLHISSTHAAPPGTGRGTSTTCGGG